MGKSDDEHEIASEQYATAIGFTGLPTVETPEASWMICKVGEASKMSREIFACKPCPKEKWSLIPKFGSTMQETKML
jgi:hypothetical protein